MGRIREKKGFTLIELIVVMAVLSILVLLAAPKFLGHTKEAQFTKHINNAKVLEDASERYYIDHGVWPRGSDEEAYTAEQVDAYAERIYDITGSELALEDGNYWDIDYAALGSYAKLPDEDERANYVLRNPVGKVYYLEGLTEAGATRVTASNEATPEVPKELTPEEINALPHGEWVAALEAKGYVMATDADFTKDTNGNWRYTGSDDYVILPHEINGVPVTSYNLMFSGYTGYGVLSNAVKGVASNSPNVTDMASMFNRSQATTLDLSSFNTANVTNMHAMFYESQATTLDLSRFDTSNVTDMRSMFQYSQTTTLDLSNFNTSKVTDMLGMFQYSQATTLDLSSFDTSNVTNMSGMFRDSQATALDLSHFETSNVSEMRFMFSGSQAVILDISGFDTASVVDMYSMFSGSKATTLDLSSFDLRNVKTGSADSSDSNWKMFENASARTGYARTAADATKLNNYYTIRPSTLTFIVKP